MKSASREGGTGGDGQASRPTAMRHGRGRTGGGARNGIRGVRTTTGRTGKGAGCHAAHRASAQRRDGDIAPYRHAAREGRTQRDRGTGHGRCARDMTAPRGTGEGARNANGKWTARRRFNEILPGASPARSALPLQVRGRLFRERHVFREPLSTRRQSSALEAYRPFRSGFSRFRLEGPLSG